jgi:O-Antigen ligase
VGVGDFNAHPGRASGFLGNPAYYGAVMSGGLAWAGVRAVAAGSRRSVAVVTAMAFGFGLSGGRISIGIVMMLAVATLVAVRGRRALTVVTAALVGFAAALLTTEFASRSSSVTRLSEQGGSGRFGMWGYGLHAWTERPVFGWGLGRTSVAVQRWITPEFANANGRDTTLLDVHNIVVTLLVTTGAVGLALALGFAFHAVRRATNRAALAFAVVVAMNWLLQPATLHTLPIAMLMLGAAAAAGNARHAEAEQIEAIGDVAPIATRRRRRAAIALGLLLAGTLTASAWAVRSASVAGDPDAMAARAWIYRGDPVVSDMIAVEYLNLTDDDDPAAIASTMEWTQRTIDADPDRAAWHLNAALRAIRFGDYDLGAFELDTLFDQQPGTFGGREARYLLAVIVHDEPGRVAAMRELCAVGSTMCGAGAASDVTVDAASDDLGSDDPEADAG